MSLPLQSGAWQAARESDFAGAEKPESHLDPWLLHQRSYRFYQGSTQGVTNFSRLLQSPAMSSLVFPQSISSLLMTICCCCSFHFYFKLCPHLDSVFQFIKVVADSQSRFFLLRKGNRSSDPGTGKSIGGEPLLSVWVWTFGSHVFVLRIDF